MRLWVLLLAMYVLVLSGVPCEALCHDEPTTAATTQGTDTPVGPDDCKNCSPLSKCAANPGFTLPASAPAWRAAPALPVLSAVQVTQYRTPHTLEIAVRIWQPPRLA